MEKDKVFKGKIKQSGIFNFKGFYEFLYDYWMDENYDVYETQYIEKVLDENSKNVEIWWSARKEISDYFKYEITGHWIILGMRKVKVQKDGKEISMDSGTLEITFEATLQKDYQNKWNKGSLKFLRKTYDKYIIKSRIEDHELKLFQEANETITQMKSFLAIEGQHAITY